MFYLILQKISIWHDANGINKLCHTNKVNSMVSTHTICIYLSRTWRQQQCPFPVLKFRQINYVDWPHGKWMRLRMNKYELDVWKMCWCCPLVTNLKSILLQSFHVLIKKIKNIALFTHFVKSFVKMPKSDYWQKNVTLKQERHKEIVLYIRGSAIDHTLIDDRAFRGTTQAPLWLLTGW